MNRLHRERALVLMALIGIWVAVALVLTPRLSHAQGGGFLWSERSSSLPSGTYVVAYNTTGSQINAGIVVMSDTTGLTLLPQISLGKGFKTWDGATGNVKKIIGVLLDNCAGNQQARILTYGWTNYVKMDATAIAGNTYLRPSLTTAGTLGAWANADTVNTFKPVVGLFSRYENTASLYGYAKVDFRSIASGAK